MGLDNDFRGLEVHFYHGGEHGGTQADVGYVCVCVCVCVFMRERERDRERERETETLNHRLQSS